MIEIRYSGKEEIELAASRAELEELRTAVLGLITADLSELWFETNEEIDPKPWDSVGKGLNIIRGRDAARVSILKESAVVIEGSDENLDSFASFLSFDETSEDGEHSHFEFFEGNEYIASDSIPLIISVI